MRATLACLVVVVTATTATAQTPYVGGSLVADVVRFSGSSDSGLTGNGETLGGALRVGTSLRGAWGVDLEFARTGEIETQPNGFRILDTPIPAVSPDLVIFPQPQISARRQASTLTTMLWWRHDVSERFDLVYLGGAAFTRSDASLRIEIPGIPIPSPIGGVLVPPRVIDQESTSYDTGVAVGLDGRIAMTERLRLVPGLRLLTVSGGWMVRPSIGIHWIF
jgi:hypothetical protein